MKYKFFDHTADFEFEAYGKSLREVFSNSALALKRIISRKKIKPKKVIKFSVKGKNLENLLYLFLEEIIFLFDSENFILSEVKNIKIKDLDLNCDFVGDFSKDYEIENHVKAITYNGMKIEKNKKGFVSRVVVDV